jgi:hypothetical protein
LVGHLSDRPQKRASITFGIRRSDRRLGGGLPARSDLSLRAIARTFGGTLDALAASNFQFAHMLAVNYQTVNDDFRVRIRHAGF